jgi:hypothetical protein
MSRNSFYLLLILSVLGASGLACRVSGLTGSGRIASETREVAGFSRINVSDGMNLFIEQSREESLRIEAEDNILPLIETSVSAGTLTIEYDRSSRSLFRSFRTTSPVKIYVTLNDIEEIEASGGSDVEAGSVQADQLTIRVSGGGDIRIDELQVETLDLELSGGSQAHLSGEARMQRVQASGGGRYQAGDLKSRTVRIQMSGGGYADINASDELEANLSGGSRVEYSGEPRVSKDTSGGSSVSSKGKK